MRRAARRRLAVALCAAAAAALSSAPRRRKKSSLSTTKRRAPPKAPAASDAFVAATLCAAQETNEAAFSPLAVPEKCRGAAATGAWFRHASLDDLFPGSGLGEAFDESKALRAGL